MTNIKNSVLSFLLAIATVCTLLPVSAFAVELTGEHICDDDNCTIEHDEHICDEDCNEYTDFLLMNEDEIPEDIITVETSEASADIYSGTIEESNIQWSVNPDTGMMLFTGEGDCPTFTSAEDQPWKHLRSLIREAWFFTMDDITAESLAHWFEGCTVLERAEIPYNTLNIGENAFASCPSLRLLMLYYSDTAPVITEGAFYTDTLIPLEIALIPGTPAAEDIYEYNWTCENRTVYFSDIYGTMLLASGYCLNCNGSYSYTLAYEQWTSSEHCVRHWCSRCGKDQLEGVGGEDHTMSNGTCTKCGYSDGWSGIIKVQSTTQGKSSIIREKREG